MPPKKRGRSAPRRKASGARRKTLVRGRPAGKAAKPRPLRELSTGYRTLIAWIVDFARRLYVLNPRSANPLAMPSVVCIDEIDLHLHQRWQRNLMKSLSEVFPKTQFICSAHNRTVAQAVPRDANLVLLRRKGDTTSRSTTTQRSSWKASADQLMAKQ